MFYEQLILAKKGVLANVWLAAHWDKKLTKHQILATDLVETVDTISTPKAPMALRLSGHLLLGVAKIYYKKVYYLYNECSEALVKIKMAFRSTVDIDLESSVANLAAITRPETFTDYELVLPEVDMMEIGVEGEEDDQLVVESEHVKELIPMRVVMQDEGAEELFGSQLLERMEEGDAVLRAEIEQDVDFLAAGGGEGGWLDLVNQMDDYEQVRPFGGGDLEVPEHQDEGVEVTASTGRESLPADVSYHEQEQSIDYRDMAPLIDASTPVRRIKRALVTTLDRSTQLSNKQIEQNIRRDPTLAIDTLALVPSSKKKLLRLERIRGSASNYFSAYDDFEAFSAHPLSDLPDPLRFALFQTEGRRRLSSIDPSSSVMSGVSLGVDPLRAAGSVDSGMHMPEYYDAPPPASDLVDLPVAHEDDDLAWLEPEMPESTDFAAELSPVDVTQLADTSPSADFGDQHRKLQDFFKAHANSDGEFDFCAFFSGKKRRLVAATFLAVLEMKSKDRIDVFQAEPYGRILVKLAASA